jgi:hypothetical protein
MASSIPHDDAPTTSPRDVPPARHRRSVFCRVSEHLAALFSPRLMHALHPESTALPGDTEVAGRSYLGIGVPECPSIAIDRVRRNHPRLPSCLLIENAPAWARPCAPRFCAGAFPIKANDHTGVIQPADFQRERISEISVTWSPVPVGLSRWGKSRKQGRVLTKRSY